MSDQISSAAAANSPPVYQIRIKGHVGHEWTDWFGGLSISLQDNGDSLLTGPVIDQAALHGLIRSVRDLGLPLVSLVRLEPEPTSGPDNWKNARAFKNRLRTKRNRTMNTNDTPITIAPSKAAIPSRKRTRSSRADWLIPAGLILLSAVPFVAGAGRLVGLASGAKITPENARFVAMPLPVVLHIIAAALFCILGAFQFAPGFRRRRPGWHRRVGRVLVPCGLIVGLSGLWMTQFYPLYPSLQNNLLYSFRMVFGSGMVLSIILSLVAIRRRDIAGHRAWIIRGYAIGQGAGTQVLTFVSWLLIVGIPGELAKELLMGAGWIINLALAEWIIRRQRTGAVPAKTAPGELLTTQIQ